MPPAQTTESQHMLSAQHGCGFAVSWLKPALIRPLLGCCHTLTAACYEHNRGPC
jgi:hypothetical protein